MNISGILSGVSDRIWSAPVIFGLFAVYLYISRKSGYPQRYIPLGLRTMFSAQGGVWRSISISLAAVLGVGNIVGVALAISLGGAGAVFWCWLAGLAGVGVQYAECLFSLRYRTRTADGSLRCGPMVAMRGTGRPRMARLYAVAVCLCGVAMGALIPANSIGEVLSQGSGIPIGFTAMLVAGLAAAVILGGAGRVFEFCTGAVPVMVLFYTGVCLAVLFICRGAVWDALRLILREAFQPRCAISGLTGYGIGRAARWGTARGLFSSEAGMGTAGISAAAAGQGVAAEQAMGCACSTVWDTLFLASLTGVTFVAAAIRGGYGFGDALALAENAFSMVPRIGPLVLPLCIAFFGFSTIVGWYYIAEQAFRFLFPARGTSAFSLFWIAAVFLGGFAAMDLVWSLSDILCVFLLVPNLAAVIKFLPDTENDTFKLRLLRSAGRKHRRKDTFDTI